MNQWKNDATINARVSDRACLCLMRGCSCVHCLDAMSPTIIVLPLVHWCCGVLPDALRSVLILVDVGDDAMAIALAAR